MIYSKLRFPNECPVCRSSFLALACRRQTVQAGEIDIFFCMECNSLCSPYATEHLNGPTLNHHLSVFHRNLEYTRLLFEKVFAHTDPTRVLNIGCGIGSLLYAAREKFKIDGIGYDIDAEACAHGQQEFGLDLRSQLWSSDEETSGVNLITCIMVAEHIKWPRPLLHEIIRASAKHSCPACVSVPWFNRSCWHHLHGPFDNKNLLEAPWVHVTHFSERGFIHALTDMGVYKFIRIEAVPWPGFLFWGKQ